MKQTFTVSVTWRVDVEVPLGTTDREIAQQVAETYFQPRIAAGEPDTACLFDVGSVLVDLSDTSTPLAELANAAQKVLDQFQSAEDSGDRGSFGMDEDPAVIALRRLIKEATQP